MHRDQIGGVNTRELARRFGTPCYFYDAATIEQRIESLRSFDVIRYAQKANSNIHLLRWMRQRDVLVDAVSAGEIQRALLAGFSATGDPSPIVYTADIFDQPSLDLVAQHGLTVNCGSTDMLAQLSERCPGSEVTLRINPGFGHGHNQKTNTGGPQSKHGIWYEQLESTLQAADRLGLGVTGLHMHIGSGTDFDHLSRVATEMERAAETAGRLVRSISAGGGLPTPYSDDDPIIDIDRYFQVWHRTRRRLEDRFQHAVSLEVEPGRYLVAECGYLLTEIRAIKTMGDNLFYLVDAGFNNLARPILYGAYHPMSISHRRASGETRQVVVGGPLCESGDIFTQQEGGLVAARELPRAQVGDLLVIECAGAYGHVMSSNYNSKPIAPEVLIDGGECRLIRRRQTIEEMLAPELDDGLDDRPD